MDDNIVEISSNMLELFDVIKHNIYISVDVDEQIYGLSYEMSLVLLLCGYVGLCCSGIIKTVNEDYIEFGPISGLKEKKMIYKNLKTNVDIPRITNNVMSQWQ